MVSFNPIGMSSETATKLLGAAGYSVRVVKVGNLSYLIHADHKPKRVNLTLNDDYYVVDFYLG